MTDDIVSFDIVHKGFATFGIASVRLGDGTVIRREIEDHGAAVAVLPYDPDRRVALLVEQFRPPVRRAGAGGRVLEAPAGVIERETPETAARREVLEEVGVGLKDLEFVGAPFTMPGISTERMSLFLARFADGDRIVAGGGLAAEHEGIRVVELTLAELARMAADGALEDLKTLALVLALASRHPELF